MRCMCECIMYVWTNKWHLFNFKGSKGRKWKTRDSRITGIFFYGKWINESHNWTRLRESYLQIKMSEEKGRCGVHSKCTGTRILVVMVIRACFNCSIYIFIFPCWYSLWLGNLTFNTYFWPSKWLKAGASLVSCDQDLAFSCRRWCFNPLSGSWDLTCLSAKIQNVKTEAML